MPAIAKIRAPALRIPPRAIAHRASPFPTDLRRSRPCATGPPSEGARHDECTLLREP